MPRSDVPKPSYAQEHAHHRPHRSGRPRRRPADHGAERLRLCRPCLLARLLASSTCAIRRSRRRSTTSRTRRTPGACTSRCMTTCCCWCRAATCSRSPTWPDERNYYKPKAGRHDAHAAPKVRNWSAGMAVYDISKPTEPRQIGFMPVEGTGHPSHLVRRRPLGLRLGDARRLLRLHPRHHRHARTRRSRRSSENTGCRA